MSDTTAVVIAGGLFGTGVWLAITGWVPVRPPLHAALGRLGQPVVEVAPTATDSIDVKVGRLARKIGVVDRALVPMRADLRILHRSPEEQAAQIVTYGVLGIFWAPIVAAGGWAVGVRFPLIIPVGVRFPLIIPVWLAAGGAVLGVLIAIKGVKPEAAKRRCCSLGHGCDGAF